MKKKATQVACHVQNNGVRWIDGCGRVTWILSVIAALWFIFMTWLSHQNGERTRKTSRKLAEGLSVFNWDKDVLHHYLRRTAHAILTILLELTLLTAGANSYHGAFLCLDWAWMK